MRATTPHRLACALAAALSACTVATTGGQCNTDDNCPTGQRCVAASGTCQACTISCTGGLTCGTEGGVEACVCPPAGPQYYVDAAGGTASNPTGAQSPVSCRFKTLTAGLAVATTAGSVVTAVGASSSAPVTFHESGPLVVGHGVTLTSDAPACSATASPPCTHLYTVVANATASPFISLAAGATISEFDIEAAVAGANAIETNCGSLTDPITVQDVKVGSAAKTGVYHAGSCPLNLESSIITGAGDSGVIIDSTSAANATASLLSNVVTGNTATTTHPHLGASPRRRDGCAGRSTDAGCSGEPVHQEQV